MLSRLGLISKRLRYFANVHESYPSRDSMERFRPLGVASSGGLASGGLRCHLAMEPGFGEALLAPYRRDGDVERLSGLLQAEAAEKAQLDDFGLARIDGGQRVER